MTLRQALGRPELVDGRLVRRGGLAQGKKNISLFSQL